MINGIIYIVFGKDYEKGAVDLIKYSRQHTDLPIHIITNICKKDRDNKWDSVNNIDFTELQMNNNENRYIKTRIIYYTPFDNTLFLDADSVIQRDGIHNIFEILNYYDIAFYLLKTYHKDRKKPQIYKDIITQMKCRYPMLVYNSGCFLFSKTKNNYKLMNEWHLFWKKYGKTRDMPPLVCAIQKNISSGLKIKTWNKEDKIFSPVEEDNTTLVQHYYSDNKSKTMLFYDKFNSNYINKDKSFDNKKYDWKQVL